jgi:membrane-associated phospholipid phosphatase
MTLLGAHLHDVRAREESAFSRIPRLVLVAFTMFVGFTAAAAAGWTAGLDRSLRLTAWLHNDVLDEVLKEVERPGQRVVILPVLFAVTAFVGWRTRRSLPWLAALLSVSFVNVVVGFVKWWSRRATPRLGGPEFFNDHISRTFGAYPSGHATNVGMWATLAWFLVHDATPHLRRAVRGAACSMAVVILACSWLRTTHWVTDLLAGLALGCALAASGLFIAQEIDRRLSRGRD